MEENTPPITTNTKKDKLKLYLIISFAFGLLLLIGFGFYAGYNVYKEKDAESTKNKEDFNLMSARYQNESRYSDSLYRVNMRFDKYRHAAESQAFRDSVMRRMFFEPGDFAYRKIDSAKVLITDKIVGGGDFDYYFRYKIMDSLGRESEIKPELLYTK